ncbi:MAG: hypothetical protein IJL32_04635 [Oscillospiraceae bacterium]|nr:hypothetical protein [Oscillospiraceae bacterium]
MPSSSAIASDASVAAPVTSSTSADLSPNSVTDSEAPSAAAETSSIAAAFFPISEIVKAASSAESVTASTEIAFLPISEIVNAASSAESATISTKIAFFPSAAMALDASIAASAMESISDAFSPINDTASAATEAYPSTAVMPDFAILPSFARPDSKPDLSILVSNFSVPSNAIHTTPFHVAVRRIGSLYLLTFDNLHFKFTLAAACAFHKHAAALRGIVKKYGFRAAVGAAQPFSLNRRLFYVFHIIAPIISSSSSNGSAI